MCRNLDEIKYKIRIYCVTRQLAVMKCDRILKNIYKCSKSFHHVSPSSPRRTWKWTKKQRIRNRRRLSFCTKMRIMESTEHYTSCKRLTIGADWGADLLYLSSCIRNWEIFLRVFVQIRKRWILSLNGSHHARYNEPNQFCQLCMHNNQIVREISETSSWKFGINRGKIGN